MPNARIPARLRALGRPLVSFLLFLLGGVILLRMDPFGLTRLTKIYSQDLLSIAMAGCYPDAKGGKCVKDGKADVSVVLLRDSDLAAFDEPWPPRYGFHARVLKAIRANKPKAVLMDIVFEDVRDDPSIELLAAELERYREAGIPVYAATFGADRPLRPEVGSRVTPVLVPKKTDPLDRVTRFYEITTGPQQSQLTAVPTVFRDVCGGCVGGCGADVVRVYWSDLPDESWNDRWLDCRRRPDFPWWIVQDRGGDFRENCPSTPTIPVRVLLEPEEEDDAVIEQLLDGGVVFYGAYYRGAADAMNTPLHNDLPAVFLHSTTLDNLITVGPQAVRHSELQLPLLGVPATDFILLVLIGAFFTARRTSGRLDAAWARMMRGVDSKLGRVLLVAFGSQVGMLVLLAGIASLLACWVGAADWVFGINFLFAFTWTELLDITEKLFEAADEFEHR
jgi:hypothetical protein